MIAAQKHLARDLSPEERRVVEKLLGKPLSDESGVEIRESAARVAECNSPLGESDRNQRWKRLEAACDQVAKVTANLTDDEVDALLDDRPTGWRNAEAHRL